MDVLHFQKYEIDLQEDFEQIEELMKQFDHAQIWKLKMEASEIPCPILFLK